MPTEGLIAEYRDLTKYVRNRLRPYSAASVCELALQSFARHPGTNADDLKSAPWITALLVKWVLEDKQILLRSRDKCPVQLFDSLRQKLWEFSPMEAGNGSCQIFLNLRVMLHTQLLFQQRETFSFLRWPALVLEMQDNHPLRVQFVKALGMSPETFIGMSWLVYANTVQGRTMIGSDYFKSVTPLYGQGVDAFLKVFSRDLEGLRKDARTEFEERLRLSKEKGFPLREPSEVEEFPWLQKYPLLRLDSDRYVIWHPLILARAIENAVHNALSGLGQEYTDPFSKEFEKYVLQLLREAGLQFMDEAAFKAVTPGRPPAVDAIVSNENGSVLIEAKMSLFPDEVVQSDNSRLVFQKLRRLREAVVQGWRVTEILENKAAAEGSHAKVRTNFLLVVANRQLNVGNGEHFMRLFGNTVFDDIAPESKFGAPSRQQRHVLPPRNMFFLSIEEFEHLCGCVSEKEADLFELLRGAAEDQAKPETAVMHFDQILAKYTRRWKTPAIQLRVRDLVERELTEFLQHKIAKEEGSREIP